MKPAKKIEKLISKINVTPDAQKDKKTLDDILNAQEKTKTISPANTQPNTWRTIMQNKITKLAVAAVIVLAVLIGINPFGSSTGGSSVAFGQVLEYFQTLNYTFDLIVEPVSQSSDQDLKTSNTINAQAMVIQPQKFRMDWFNDGDEVSVVIDFDAKHFLQLFHKDKIGKTHPYTEKMQGDFSSFFSKPVERLWDLQDGSEEYIGENDLDGQDAIGFKIIQDSFEIIIWADSNSGLPIFVEAVSSPNNYSISTKWVMENFDFEVELDEEAFSLDGPAEYTIVNQFGKIAREAMIDHGDQSSEEVETQIENASEFLIKPLEGVGFVKFGMMRTQVIDILGEPDQFLKKHCLDYSSTIGLSLLVHSNRGLLAIDCWSKEEKSTEGHLCGAGFPGRTLEGIGINSTKNELVSFFGKEYEEYLHKNPNIFELSYPQLNIVFRLKDNKIIHISLQHAL